MPYITETSKEKFVADALTENSVDWPNWCGIQCDNAGDLNYVFTKIAHAYLSHKGLKYQHLNDIIGALEGAKQELYRRVAAPYEDTKIKENGDVMDIH
jgi:hypothetical protein